MLSLETRPFEARFGSHCPFCGKSWGDPNPCGDSRADWTFKGSMRTMFAAREERECYKCHSVFQARPREFYCDDCKADHKRAVDREKTARYRERHKVDKVCDFCYSLFATAKKDQRFCSLSCGNKNRAREKA
jgi:hypothetical protein